MGEYAEERLAQQHPEVFGDEGFRRSRGPQRAKEKSMTSTELALPATGDSSAWSDSEKALVEAAGLVATRNGQKELAPRPVVEAFLMQCRRTGLDPIARQIYCIQRAGKWQTQVSIDGARLVAERTGQYEGQTPVEWTADGVTWTQVWLSEQYPAASRVGVYRRGFQEPLYAVARWSSYVVMKDVWANNRKTGEQVVSDMWAKMPDLMLGKVAEMLALRKAFPQDLSGLYSTEEMQQADRQAQPAQPTPAVPAAPVQPQPVATINWALQIADVPTVPELGQVFARAQEAGELGLPFAPEHQQHVDALVQLFELSQPPANVKVGQMIGAVKAALEEQATRATEAASEPADGEVVYDGGGKALRDADEQQAHQMDAEPVTEWPTAQPGGGQAA